MQRTTSARAGRDRTRGQALVELALIVPILLMLFLATVDLGRFFYSQITITNSAREAAMEAATDPTSYLAGTCDAVNSRVICAATNAAKGSFVTVSPADVTLECLPDPLCPKTYGQQAKVTVTGQFTLLTPLMSGFLGGSTVTVTSTAGSDVVIVPAVAGMPTPTPTPAATPEPTPEGTPAPTPEPTPTPVPTPTPTPCAPAVAAFMHSQATKQDPVVFSSTSTPTSGECAITYWRWEFGDGTIDAANVPTTSHNYGASKRGDTFTVGLTVTVPGGITTTVYQNVTTMQ